MEWLRPAVADLKARPLRLLEVGALSVDNACSRSGCFDVERIDLNSQAPGILQQDFMRRPLPESDADRFDIISLSLVLNYVPHHGERGDMLLRTLDFLRDAAPAPAPDAPESYFPQPLPCPPGGVRVKLALPRRRQAEDHHAVARVRGGQVQGHAQARALPLPPGEGAASIIPNYTKKEIRPGVSRNNFSIVLQPL